MCMISGSVSSAAFDEYFRMAVLHSVSFVLKINCSEKINALQLFKKCANVCFVQADCFDRDIFSGFLTDRSLCPLIKPLSHSMNEILSKSVSR